MMRRMTSQETSEWIGRHRLELRNNLLRYLAVGHRCEDWAYVASLPSESQGSLLLQPDPERLTEWAKTAEQSLRVPASVFVEEDAPRESHGGLMQVSVIGLGHHWVPTEALQETLLPIWVAASTPEERDTLRQQQAADWIQRWRAEVTI